MQLVKWNRVFYHLLGCDIIESTTHVKTPLRNLPPLSSDDECSCLFTNISKFYQTIRCHIPEDGKLYSHCHRNIKISHNSLHVCSELTNSALPEELMEFRRTCMKYYNKIILQYYPVL
jgi:hypothetical protein